jgi:hypothetical protein
MSRRDAIPSGDGHVAIPEDLSGRLRSAADRCLTRACDLAFLPECRDAVIDAVHLLDAIDGSELPRHRVSEVTEALLVLESHDAEGDFDRQTTAVRALLDLYKAQVAR